MSDKDSKVNIGKFREGYQPNKLEKFGYTATEGEINSQNPPNGGSAMPSSSQASDTNDQKGDEKGKK